MALTKVSTDGIKDDAITSGKIPANAIGNSELAVNSVQGGNITNSAISNDKVHPSANIAGSKLADNSISLAKLEHGTSSNDGKFLRANNGADPSFETVNIPAGTTINNNADNRLITGSGTANTLNGESDLVYDGNYLSVGGSFSASPHRIGIRDSSGNALSVGNSSASSNGSHDAQIVAQEGTFFNNLKLTGQSVKFFANGSGGILERARVTDNGITFNGDTAAANALDDYEEGSFTPTMRSSNNMPSFSYANNRGKYVKVGRQVTAWIFMQATIGGTETGNLYLQDLPFTVRDEYAQILITDYGNWQGFPSGHAGLGGYAQVNDDHVVLLSYGDKTSGGIHASNWGNNTYFYATLSYMTDS